MWYVYLQVTDFVRGRGGVEVAISTNGSQITQKNTNFGSVDLTLHFLLKRRGDEYQGTLKIK